MKNIPKYFTFLIVSMLMSHYIIAQEVVDSLSLGLVASYSFTNSSLDGGVNKTGISNFGAGFADDRFTEMNASLAIESQQYALIDNPLIDLQGDFTINHWFYLESINTNAFQYTLNSRQDLAGNERGGLDILIDRDSLLNFTFRRTTGNNRTTSFQRIVDQKLITENWYMATVSKENNQVKIYLNNQLVFDESTDFSFQSGILWVLGAIVQPDISRELDGRIDDISFYDRALEDDEVSALFNNNQFGVFNPAPTDIILSSNTIAENNAINDVIGTLSTLDENSSEFTYILSGDDAASFSVVDSELQAAVSFDFETQNSFDLTITTIDEGNRSFTEDFEIIIENSRDDIDLDQGLLSRFSFDGGAVTDEIGSNDGQNFGASSEIDRFNRVDSSLNIDGSSSDQYVLINDPVVSLENDFTINHWFYLTSINTNQFQYTLNSRQDLSGNERGGLDVLIDRDSLLNFTFRRTTGNNNTTSFQRKVNQKLVTEKWYMATVSKENDQVKIYLNNQLVFNESTDFSFQSGVLWVLGAIVQPAVSRELDGRIDDISFYDRALQDDEISTLFNNDQFGVFSPAPTDIMLSSNTIAENNTIGNVIGTLSSVDENSSVFTYTLSGEDAAAFSIVGNELQAAVAFDFETQNSFNLTITTTDESSKSFSENFEISVTNILEVDGLSQGLMHQYSFNGGDLEDEVGNMNGTNFQATFGEDRFNITGRTLEIAGDNSDQYALINDPLIALENDFTINHWFYLESINTNAFQYTLNSRQDLAGNERGGLDILVDRDGLLNFTFRRTTSNNRTTSFQRIVDQKLITENWYMATVSKENDQLKIYLNNQLIFDESTDFSFQSGILWVLGAIVQPDVSRELDGRIDDISFYDRALTNDEVEFLFTAENVNSVPTDITLSNTDFTENQDIGTQIGLFSTQDIDNSQFLYTLSGADAANFSIVNNQLLTAIDFDFETADNFNFEITVTSDDQSGGIISRDFTLTLMDINEAPFISENSDLTAITLVEDTPSFTNDLTNDFEDLDANDNLSFSATVGNSALNPSISNGLLTVDISENYFGETTLTVTATDNEGLSISTTFMVTVTPVNDDPIGINLSTTSLPENQAAGTVVGMLTTNDVDGFDTHTYTIDSETDFTINGNQLITARSFNFEEETLVELSITTTDQDGGSFARIFTLDITDQNDVPTAINLTASSLAENNEVGVIIGALSTEDEDVSDTFSYSVTGEDAASFSISDNELTAGIGFNFEQRSTFEINITTMDQNGGSFTREFTITITDENDAPSDIDLSAAAIAENNEEGAVIGTLSTVDEDESSGTFTYSLAGEDAANFRISGNELIAEVIFDFETRNEFNITIITTDNTDLTFEEAFTISITDVEEIVTSTSSADLTNEISLYPNPFTDRIYLESNALSSQVMVFDTAGKLVFTTAMEEQKGFINLESLQTGIYYLNISNEKGSYQVRIAKN